MTEQGKIENVVIEHVGSVLVGDHALGATSLTVNDAGEFDPTSTLVINGQLIGYTADVDLDVLLLTDPLAAAADDGEKVYLYPESEEKVAYVKMQSDADLKRCVIRTDNADKVDDGPRDEFEQETCICEINEETEQWEVVQIVGRTPQVSGRYINEQELDIPNAPDGQPPGVVTTIGVVPSLRNIFLKWSPVLLNAVGDLQKQVVTYHIYASDVSPVVADSAHEVGSTTGTLASIGQLGDQTPLQQDTQYFFLIVAEDDDGMGIASAEVPGQLDKTAPADFAVGSIIAAALESVMVLGTTITTRAKDPTDPSGNTLIGPGITLTPTSMTAYDAEGRPRLEIDPTLAKYVWRGDAEIDHLTVLTLTTLQESILAQGSTMTLQSAVATPAQPPVPTFNWQTNGYADDGAWAQRFGWAVLEDIDRAYCMRKGTTYWYFEAWDTVTKTRVINYLWEQVTMIDGNNCTVACAIDPLEVYILQHYNGGQANNEWETWQFDTVNLGFFQYIGIGSKFASCVAMNTKVCPAMAFDEVAGNFVFAWVDATSGVLKFQRGNFHLPNWTAVGSVITTTLTVGNNNLASLLNTSADFGATRWVVAGRNSTNVGVKVFDTTGARKSDEEWPLDVARNLNGMWWDPDAAGAGIGRFKVQHYGSVYTYEGGGNWWSNTVNTGAATWWLSYRWRNSTTSEASLLSDPASFSMKKRAILNVTIPGLPTGVNAADLFVGRATTKPSVLAISMKGNGAFDVTDPTHPKISVSSIAIIGPDNNIVSTFLAGTPAKWISEAKKVDGVTPLLDFRGNGYWSIHPLGKHDPTSGSLVDKFDTDWVEIAAASGMTKAMAQWRRFGPLVMIRWRITTNSALSYTASGAMTDTALLAAIPTEVKPVEHTYPVTSQAGKGAQSYVSATDGITRIQAVDGNGTAGNIAAGAAISGNGYWFL